MLETVRKHMTRYSSKIINLLIRMRDGEHVPQGAFSSELAKDLLEQLKSRGAVLLQRNKSRGVYYAPDPQKLLSACSEISPELSNLDAASRLAAGEEISRSESVEEFGDSKAGSNVNAYKGFSLISNERMTINYFGEEFTLMPTIGVHVIDWKGIWIPEDVTVIGVENSQCFYCLDWIKNLGLKGRFVILNRFPVCEEAKLWLESIPNRYIHFGDFDLGGVQIYESEFKRRLGERASFLLPDDIEERIRLKGNAALYTKQMKTQSGVTSPSGELNHLLEVIHSCQKGYEQEGYNLP